MFTSYKTTGAGAKNDPSLMLLSRTRPHPLTIVVLAVVSSLLGWNRGIIIGDDGGHRLVIVSAFVPPPSSLLSSVALPSPLSTTTTTTATRRRREPATIVGHPLVATPVLSLLGGGGGGDFDVRINSNDRDREYNEKDEEDPSGGEHGNNKHGRKSIAKNFVGDKNNNNCIDDDDVDFDESDSGVPTSSYSSDQRQGATFFGLEPKAPARGADGNFLMDPLDDGLRFTGPIVMLISIYVMLSLFFGNDDVMMNL
ncbi:hypothetical protein ACHAXA_008085 [Cyclostephanos tholiformis]|uniref:Uncharacterized protein n=1 Tax=Cyclostephanos tholiformis TaxID=382380 RepID=A0ABD3RVN9_9STRA